MRGILKNAIRAGISLPASILRATRNYQPLEKIASAPSPKILIIACHWIGDTLWAAQVVPHLRKVFPTCHLSCLCKPICTPLWSADLAVDCCIPSKAVISDRLREQTDWTALWRLGRELHQQNWDLIIDLTGNRYSALLTHWINAKHTIGFDGSEFGGLYATKIDNAERENTHLSERPFRVIEPLNGDFACSGNIIPPKPALSYEDACTTYNINPEIPLAIIAPGAGWAAKEWADDNFCQLGTKLINSGYRLALIDSPDKRERLRNIAAKLPQQQTAIVAEPSLDNALAIIAGCSVFIGNDSGLGHIAAAMGRKTISIFTGDTDPQLCGPLGTDAHAINADTPEQIDQILDL